MIGGKNLIVFFIACAFAYYQFNKAKGRAAIHSPQHQLKVSKTMMQHQLNMYEYEIVDATNTRGESYVMIMERIKESMGKDKETAKVVQTPKILGVLVEDRVATRMYRNNVKHGRKRHQYRKSRYQSQAYGRNRGQHRRRHGVHPNRRSSNKQAIHYEPRLKLLKYSTRLDKVEFLLVQRGLITNKIGKNKKETKDQDQIEPSKNKHADAAAKKEKLSEEEIKKKSVKEIEKRKLDKVSEEGKKKSEQEKKSKEENRKKQKKAGNKENGINEENKIVDATIDTNGESNFNEDGA